MLPTIAVVTNMDPEHLDHWGTPEAMIAGYDQFVANVPFYGFAVLCIDHPAVQAMIDGPRHFYSGYVVSGVGEVSDWEAASEAVSRLRLTVAVGVGESGLPSVGIG